MILPIQFGFCLLLRVHRLQKMDTAYLMQGPLQIKALVSIFLQFRVLNVFFSFDASYFIQGRKPSGTLIAESTIVDSRNSCLPDCRCSADELYVWPATMDSGIEDFIDEIQVFSLSSSEYVRS